MMRSPLAQAAEKVPTFIYPSASHAVAELAQEVVNLIQARASEGKMTVLGLATGSTPVPFYRELIKHHREGGVSFNSVITFNLDEYHGLAPSHRESYRRFMQEQLFDHIDIRPENINVPDGLTPLEHIHEACQTYEEAIEAAGGIDFQILGIGRTGHIGFNEPGSTQDSRTRLIALDRVTRLDAAADFLGEVNVPRFAITMGVGTILRAKRIVLMAWGENKAEMIREAVEGPQTEAVSASFLQSHAEARIFIDQAAAKALTRVRLPWLVGPVTWDEMTTARAVSWLSARKKKPVLKLQDEDYNENGMAELLTRHGSAYHLNIQIFNRFQHSVTGWPGGKKNADDTTRPERALPYPKRSLILAPEPQDEVLGMGATVQRLVDHGHEVNIAYFASGDLRVSDSEVAKFAKILIETAEAYGGDWAAQREYAQKTLTEIERKGPFGDPPELLRRLKSQVRRGEARDAVKSLGVSLDHVQFLDLPFYQQGRYRQFKVTAGDVQPVKQLLEKFQPHQIYLTGHLADPNSVQGVAWRIFLQAWHECHASAWLKECRVWLYRGHQKELEPHELAMAVPMSPDQLAAKLVAVQKFQSHNTTESLDGQRNRRLAQDFDRLGLAEYEAIEAFERWC